MESYELVWELELGNPFMDDTEGKYTFLIVDLMAARPGDQKLRRIPEHMVVTRCAMFDRGDGFHPNVETCVMKPSYRGVVVDQNGVIMLVGIV